MQVASLQRVHHALDHRGQLALTNRYLLYGCFNILQPSALVFDLTIKALHIDSEPFILLEGLSILFQLVTRVGGQRVDYLVAVWVEPGRYLVAEAGVLLARVTQVKRKGALRYVGLDAGMNSLVRPALYGAHHDVVNLTRLGEPAAGPAEVVGPICESADVFGRGRDLPETHEGDVLLIDTAGAYGAVMASRYNRRRPAAEVAV